eukprot:TRINITY_DN7662_c4_g1_i1.p1 TRINITY_DN7662_c4_g1~~TRINITY_DN7662_c4_g1_i1.p1  ORF type:complete len:629 (+),score=172.82 TRINITY_DN7662_c4_g1_i1:137-1888(+)
MREGGVDYGALLQEQREQLARRDSSWGSYRAEIGRNPRIPEFHRELFEIGAHAKHPGLGGCASASDLGGSLRRMASDVNDPLSPTASAAAALTAGIPAGMRGLMEASRRRLGVKSPRSKRKDRASSLVAVATGVPLAQRSVLGGGLRQRRGHDGLPGVADAVAELKHTMIRSSADEAALNALLADADGTRIGADVLVDDVADAGAPGDPEAPRAELDGLVRARLGAPEAARPRQLPGAADSPGAQSAGGAFAQQSIAACKQRRVFRLHTHWCKAAAAQLAAAGASEEQAMARAAERLLQAARRDVKEVRKRTQEGGWTFGQQVNVDGITLFVPRGDHDRKVQLRSNRKLRPWERAEAASPTSSLPRSPHSAASGGGSAFGSRLGSAHCQSPQGKPQSPVTLASTVWSPRRATNTDHSREMVSLHLSLLHEYREQQRSGQLSPGSMRPPGSGRRVESRSSPRASTPAAPAPAPVSAIAAAVPATLAELDSSEARWEIKMQERRRLSAPAPAALAAPAGSPRTLPVAEVTKLREEEESGREEVSQRQRHARVTLVALSRRHSHLTLLYSGGGAALAARLSVARHI